MLKIEQFEKGQVWMLTQGPRRVAEVLGSEPYMLTVPGEVGKPPTKEPRTLVTVRVVTPARPIEGFVTQEEADVSLKHRQQCKRDFDYDMWTEQWIDWPRNKYDPDPRHQEANEKVWEFMVRVFRVNGRHGAHESINKSGRIANCGVDGTIIPSEDVPSDLFDEIADDQETQKELNDAALKAKTIAEYKLEEAAKKKEARKGDAAEYAQWCPASVLKMQMDVCGIKEPENTGDGTFNKASRKLLKDYLVGIGINPWDVMDMKRDPFQEAVDAAR